MANPACLVRRTARRFGDFPAIVTQARTIFFNQLDTFAEEVRGGVANLAPSTLELPVCPVVAHKTEPAFLLFTTLTRLGRPACMIDPKLPKPRVEQFLALLGLADKAATARLQAAVSDPSNPVATIVFTSGSSGVPKAVAHTYAAHAASAAAANANMPVGPGDRWLLSLSMSHVAGLGIWFRCMLGGGAVVLPDGQPLGETLESLGVTHVSLVPTQLRRLMRSKSDIARLARLKGILLGGAPMPEPLIRRASELGLPIATSYGMTETASQITATRPGESVDALLTAGRPLTPDTVDISPDGEILARGPALFAGYLANGELQSDLAMPWFATGDLGRMDAQGRLIVQGRRDNRFICGGENIQPEEIERALSSLPEVNDAVVVPRPDEEYGAVPVAFVKTDEGILEPDRLAGKLAETLPRYMVPRQFFPWPEPNESALEKPGRKLLTEMAAQM